MQIITNQNFSAMAKHFPTPKKKIQDPVHLQVAGSWQTSKGQAAKPTTIAKSSINQQFESEGFMLLFWGLSHLLLLLETFIDHQMSKQE